MNLRQLEYFVHVAESGSFSKAAQVLAIAQPALSRQVRLLEADLHASLLCRHSRGVALTEAGQLLFDHGVSILERMAQAEEELGGDRDGPTGRIVVGLPPTLGHRLTLPLVEGFRSRLPKAKLAVVEGFSTHIVDWVASGRVDLGVVYNPEAQPAIKIAPVLDETLHLVQAATAGPRKPLPLRELSRCPLIVPDRQHALRRLIETRAALAGVKLDILWEVASVPAIIDLVCAGHGYAVLTASVVAASGRSAEVAVRPIVEPEVASVVCLATRSSHLPTPLARHAAKLLTELLRAMPSVDAAVT